MLPLRDENHMKAYLLLPAQRRALLRQQGGRLEEAPQGALGLEPLLQVRKCGGWWLRLDVAALLVAPGCPCQL